MATTTERLFVLPGEAIDPSRIPTHSKRPLRLGPGLRHLPPSEILPTVAGRLITEPKKTSMWIEYNGGRYVPTTGDLVIGQVHHSSADYHFVTLSPYTPNALLPVLAFEGATRKTRPHLHTGSLVYARVALADRHMEPELECISQTTGKADGLGLLVPTGAAPTFTTGGSAATVTAFGTNTAGRGTATSTSTVFTVSLGFARRLLMPNAERDAGLVVLDALAAEGLAFETAVGRNGKVWVASESVSTIVLVGRALAEVDEKGLDVVAQRKLVKRLVREMS